MGDAFLVFSRSKAEGTPAAPACADPSDDQVGGRVGRHSAMHVCSCCQVTSRPTGAPSGLYDAPGCRPLHTHMQVHAFWEQCEAVLRREVEVRHWVGACRAELLQSCLGSVREEKE